MSEFVMTNQGQVKHDNVSQYIIMYFELFLSGSKKCFMVGTIFFSGYICTGQKNQILRI